MEVTLPIVHTGSIGIIQALSKPQRGSEKTQKIKKSLYIYPLNEAFSSILGRFYRLVAGIYEVGQEKNLVFMQGKVAMRLHQPPDLVGTKIITPPRDPS